MVGGGKKGLLGGRNSTCKYVKVGTQEQVCAQSAVYWEGVA